MELTDAKIDLLRAEAQLLGLSGAELLEKNSNDLIRRVCNGIGPSSFPEKARAVLNKLLPHILLPSLIHDLRYYYGTGSFNDFSDANHEMAFNARLVARRGVAWWRVLRKLAIAWAGVRCGSLCEYYGWGAYCNAIYERVKEEEKRSFQARSRCTTSR